MTADIIAPSEISFELKRIWDSLEGTNKMRASLFNLIFYTKTGPRESYIRTISEKVIEKFPSRMIFITENSDSPDSYLNTHVSVMSSKEEQSSIACDSIQINVAGSYTERIPFVILPHVLPDLPVYVIWAEDPCTPSPLFDQLQKLASRMIFDSESIENLATFASRLVSLEKEQTFDIADLNWARTESWRELLASAFYTSERLQMLNKATEIQIRYNTHRIETYCHTPIQSLYLNGWVATQMGWSLQSIKRNGDKWTLTYLREGGTVIVTLFPEDHSSIKPGAIVSVELKTANHDHFSFGCNLDIPYLVNMCFSTIKKCDVPLKYIFGKEESGKSLVKEICHRGTSKHFFALLKHLCNQKELTFCES